MLNPIGVYDDVEILFSMQELTRTILITVVSFLGILIVLTMAHELGHFFTAKKFGIKVKELGLGYPPRLWSIKRGETVYSINAVLLGGFTKMLGEEDPSQPGSLASKGIGARIVVLSAGSLMNALLPILLLSISLMIPHNLVIEKVSVSEVIPNSPAALAGIQPGDQILEVNWVTVHNMGELKRGIYLSLGREMDIRVMHPDLTIKNFQLTPRWKAPGDQTATGLLAIATNSQIIKKSHPFWFAIPLAVYETVNIFIIFKNALVSTLLGVVPVILTGPVGLAQIVGEIAKGGIHPLLQFAALFNFNVALLNLFPLPALDGGRIAFVVLEWIRRGKRISAKIEGMIHGIGFALLLVVAMLITYQDVLRIIHGETILK
jgi:regulator of sigma E protease